MSAVAALARPGSDGVRPEVWLFAAALVLANLTLLEGRAAEALLFFPAAVEGGEWWRIVTFPWAHVSWYHLLLDGVAFFMLYGALREARAALRLLVLAAAGGGSLAAALACAPAVREIGLGGLSGIDHGLMAFGALECLSGADPRARREGRWLLGAVVLKATLEALSGRVLLGPFHFGLMGVPVAACHLGGVVGGAAAFFALGRIRAAARGRILARDSGSLRACDATAGREPRRTVEKGKEPFKEGTGAAGKRSSSFAIAARTWRRRSASPRTSR